MAIMYHVTPTKNLRLIMIYGLVPRKGPRSSKLENKKAVYLFPNLDDVENALMNWLGDEFGDEQLALLKVNVKGEVYSDAEYERYVTTTIQPSNIKVLTDDLDSIDDIHALKEMQNKVKRGSQKRKLLPQATDKPEKYIGEPKYKKPQGIRVKKKVYETIRKSVMVFLNSDYVVVDDNNEKVGVAQVMNGTIENMAVKKGVELAFKGQVLDRLMQQIVKDADTINANLSIQVIPDEIDEIKTFLERFGFRHVGDNIMRRTAGSIRPPSVIRNSSLEARITESKQNPKDVILSEAFWWLERWVSGSINDPDWDEEWLTKVHNLQDAFNIISKVVGNRYAVGKTLWRSLVVDKATLKIMKQKKILPVHKIAIQSFTPDKDVAIEFGEDLYVPDNHVPVLVAVDAPSEAILTSMMDIQKSKLTQAKEALRSLGDWSHQKEVFVKVEQPLPVKSIQIIQ